MSTVENITPVTEEKNNLKEVVEKKTVIENVDKDEPETKKQRLSDIKDIKDTEDEKAQNGEEIDDEEEEPKELDEEVDDKDDEDEVESPEKTKEDLLKEKDCNGSTAQVTENGDSAEKEEVNA